MNKKNKIFSFKFKGFTLVEMMLSIALIVAIGSISAPVYQSFQVRNDINNSSDQVVQSLRRAQILSMAVEEDSNWGVIIQSGSIVIFKGASYLGRDSSYDEIFQIANTIIPSGVTEVVFDKLSGIPQSSGDIILISPNGDTKTISINSKGIIEY